MSKAPDFSYTLELILAPGRSYDEAGQVEKFLGRPAGEDAFLKSIDAA